MNREAETSGNKPWRLKATYIPRLMPVGMIVILLAILLPELMERKPDAAGLPQVDPPLAMKRYSTNFPASDSLMNDALRCFGRKDYEAAARILSKVHFYWNVQIREGKTKFYPEDLRFYLGLAEFYRGRPDRAAPFLEAESRDNPHEEKYAWYLAHVYSALGDTARSRETLERIVSLNETLAPKAADILGKLPR
ncbi:MAG: tetratricopeptide repeat protein [Candidatus Krumholzibacteria bacterium]|nr:tetratricopeptide repeat protein [Candidatus Krumholzibacteria bacterium]